MKLKVCKNHPNKIYTLQSICSKCKKPTLEAHYKYIKTISQ